MDIRSGKEYPSSALSNFAPHRFEIDGVACNSMEGFLQSLKFKNPEMQKQICTLVGYAAKQAGKNKNWQERQTLYWLGEAIPRESTRYQQLLNQAYEALAHNEKFQKALLATGDAVLTHSLGRNDPKQTVLTQKEFCSRLMKIREFLKKENG